MKRFAVLISGQPRNIFETYSNINDNVIKPNNADVFIHSWIDPEMVGKCYYSQWLIKHNQLFLNGEIPKPASSPTPANIDSHILELYSPKKHLFELPRKFLYNQALDKKVGTTSIYDILSQQYSIHSVNKLKKIYEHENKFNYDAVFRIRFGMKFFSKVLLEDFIAENILFVPSGFDGFDPKCSFLNHISFCDHWSIGSSRIMDLLSETYHHVEELCMTKDVYPQNEDLIGYWMRVVNKKQIALIDISYRLNCF